MKLTDDQIYIKKKSLLQKKIQQSFIFSSIYKIFSDAHHVATFVWLMIEIVHYYHWYLKHKNILFNFLHSSNILSILMEHHFILCTIL